MKVPPTDTHTHTHTRSVKEPDFHIQPIAPRNLSTPLPNIVSKSLGGNQNIQHCPEVTKPSTTMLLVEATKAVAIG